MWLPKHISAATREFELPNGIRVFVAQIARLDACHASVVQGFGHFDAPARHPDLAHLLEHIQCEARRGDPRPSFYAFAKRHGTANASTGPRHTHYHFSVPQPFLAEGLQHLARTLLPPDPTDAHLARELQVTGSEQHYRQTQLKHRMHDVIRSCSAVGNGFQPGNRRDPDPAPDLAEVRRALETLHLDHARTHRTAVVVLGTLSPDVMADCVRASFGSLPANTAPVSASVQATVPLDHARGSRVQITSTTDFPQLQLLFPIALPDEMGAAPFMLGALLSGHWSENLRAQFKSCQSGWGHIAAQHISVDVIELNHRQRMLWLQLPMIDSSITDRVDRDTLDTLIHLTFSFIRSLRAESDPRICDPLTDSPNPTDLLSKMYQVLPATLFVKKLGEGLLAGGHVWNQKRPHRAALDALLDQLTPQNAVVVQGVESVEHPTDHLITGEAWHVAPIPAPVLERWASPHPEAPAIQLEQPKPPSEEAEDPPVDREKSCDGPAHATAPGVFVHALYPAADDTLRSFSQDKQMPTIVVIRSSRAYEAPDLRSDPLRIASWTVLGHLLGEKLPAAQKGTGGFESVFVQTLCPPNATAADTLLELVELVHSLEPTETSVAKARLACLEGPSKVQTSLEQTGTHARDLFDPLEGSCQGLRDALPQVSVADVQQCLGALRDGLSVHAMVTLMPTDALQPCAEAISDALVRRGFPILASPVLPTVAPVIEGTVRSSIRLKGNDSALRVLYPLTTPRHRAHAPLLAQLLQQPLLEWHRASERAYLSTVQPDSLDAGEALTFDLQSTWDAPADMLGRLDDLLRTCRARIANVTEDALAEAMPAVLAQRQSIVGGRKKQFIPHLWMTVPAPTTDAIIEALSITPQKLLQTFDELIGCPNPNRVVVLGHSASSQECDMQTLSGLAWQRQAPQQPSADPTRIRPAHLRMLLTRNLRNLKAEYKDVSEQLASDLFRLVTQVPSVAPSTPLAEWSIRLLSNLDRAGDLQDWAQQRLKDTPSAADRCALLNLLTRTAELNGDTEAQQHHSAEALRLAWTAPKVPVLTRFTAEENRLAAGGYGRDMPPGEFGELLTRHWNTLQPLMPEFRDQLYLTCMQLSTYHAEEGRWADAANCYAQLTPEVREELLLSDPELIDHCGVLHRNARDYQPALGYALRAHRRVQEPSKCHNLALVLAALGRFQEARPYAVRAAETVPATLLATGWVLAWRRLALALCDAADDPRSTSLGACTAELVRLLKDDPQRLQIMRNLISDALGPDHPQAQDPVHTHAAATS